MKTKRRNAKKVATQKAKDKKKKGRLGGTKAMAERWSRHVGVGKGL